VHTDNLRAASRDGEPRGWVCGDFNAFGLLDDDGVIRFHTSNVLKRSGEGAAAQTIAVLIGGDVQGANITANSRVRCNIFSVTNFHHQASQSRLAHIDSSVTVNKWGYRAEIIVHGCSSQSSHDDR